MIVLNLNKPQDLTRVFVGKSVWTVESVERTFFFFELRLSLLGFYGKGLKQYSELYTVKMEAPV